MNRRGGALILWAMAVVVAWSAAGCRPAMVAPVPPPAPPPVPPQASGDRMIFHATAYSIEGRTASGVPARAGIVAADPAVLPLGSRIRVHDAGQYDGEYLVADTGRKIDGSEIDIYLVNDREAKRFGNKRVAVEVLEYGSRKGAAR